MGLTIYTAGSARKNENIWIGSYAYAIYKNGKAIYQLSSTLHPATQNESELIAVMHAIYKTRELYPNEPIQIYTGSQYVFGGCENVTRIKSNIPLWETFHQLYNKDHMSIQFTSKKDKNAKGKHVAMLAKMKLKTQFKPVLNR